MDSDHQTQSSFQLQKASKSEQKETLISEIAPIHTHFRKTKIILASFLLISVATLSFLTGQWSNSNIQTNLVTIPLRSPEELEQELFELERNLTAMGIIMRDKLVGTWQGFGNNEFTLFEFDGDQVKPKNFTPFEPIDFTLPVAYKQDYYFEYAKYWPINGGNTPHKYKYEGLGFTKYCVKVEVDANGYLPKDENGDLLFNEQNVIHQEAGQLSAFIEKDPVGAKIIWVKTIAVPRGISILLHGDFVNTDQIQGFEDMYTLKFETYLQPGKEYGLLQSDVLTRDLQIKAFVDSYQIGEDEYSYDEWMRIDDKKHDNSNIFHRLRANLKRVSKDIPNIFT